MQRSDPFAAIRKHADATEAPSFDLSAEHLEHPNSDAVFPENWRKTAVVHQEHPEHRQAHVPGKSSFEGLPAEWRDGLAALQQMAPPIRMPAARWEQVKADAERFAWGRAEEAAAIGWDLSELIGFDPDQPEVECLVRAMRGGTIASMFTDDRGRRVASIAMDGGFRCHYAGRLSTATPLWQLQGAEK